MEKLVSIIIPAYNVEDYLGELLDSLCNQTYKNLEIILVNDGSTDHTLEICNEYASRDNRIKVVNQTNAGQAAARNNGLETSSGDYVYFVDGDDIVRTDTISVLMKNLINNDADISSCEYIKFSDSIPDNIDRESKIEILARDESMRELLADERIHSYVWTKIFKKSLFMDNNIRFPNTSFEDLATVYLLYHNAKASIHDNYIGYLYRHRNNSDMHTLSEKKVNCYIEVTGKLIDFYKNNYSHMADDINKFIVMTTANAHRYCMINKHKNLYNSKKMIDRYNNAKSIYKKNKKEILKQISFRKGLLLVLLYNFRKLSYLIGRII